MSTASINTQLSAIMAAEGLSQADLADWLKVDRSRVSVWKNGKAVPHAKTVKKIYARYLKAIEMLAHGDPLRRIRAMQAEMENAIRVMSAESIEELHASICRRGAEDMHRRYVEPPKL